MALADVVLPYCSFHWDIHHPFTPWSLLSARFYHGSPNFTLWKVTIKPLRRRINCWTFAFYLELEDNFDGSRQITANRVQVGIFLNNRCISEKSIPNVSFRLRNFYTYRFYVNAIANVQQDQELLVVKITLDFPAEAADTQYTIDDSRWLSRDLSRLLTNEVQSNMQLHSSTGETLPVHSCILDARWDNFFNLHPFEEGMSVDINVSVEVLRDILIYLYSGNVHFRWSRGRNYIPELFYVINRYQLNHLRKVMQKRDMKQRRVSIRDASTITLIFPLGDLLSGQIVASTRTWRGTRNQYTPYELTFKIQVQTYCGPWLSYSLISRSGIQVYAQVSLDIRKKIVETRGAVEHTFYQIMHVHQCDYTIHPNSSEESRNVLFLGCPETFRNLDLVNRPAQFTEGCDSILFTLKFTDGKIDDQIESTLDDLDAEQDEMERLNILGDHLFRLFSTKYDADLRIIAPTENVNQPEEHYQIHQAIFEARVPRWWRVFQDVQERGAMPNVARLLLRHEALPFVLRYMYSSRSGYVTRGLLNDIQHFADTGEFHSLSRHIINIRNKPDVGGSDSE